MNWCPHLQTALSDVEVDVDQIDGPTRVQLPGRDAPVEVGWIDTFAYTVTKYPNGDPCEGTPSILVSTTRLETMLGDAAVAVHPDDTRFSHFIGASVLTATPFQGVSFGCVLPVCFSRRFFHPYPLTISRVSSQMGFAQEGRCSIQYRAWSCPSLPIQFW